LFGIKGLGEEAWKLMAKALPPQLTHLDLGSCNMGSKMSYVISELHRLNQLEELDLSGNDLASVSNLDKLYSSISGMNHLHELLLQSNRLNSSQALSLIPSLPQNLKKLWLQNNNIDDSTKSLIRTQLGSRLERIEL